MKPNKLKDCFLIRVENKNDAIIVANFLKGIMGLEIGGGTASILHSEGPLENTHYIGISNCGGLVSLFYDRASFEFKKVFSCTELNLFLEWFAQEENTETVKISNQYDAVISGDGIVVGCQNISWDIFDKIVGAVKRVRK
jgi:hypothetical protein